MMESREFKFVPCNDIAGNLMFDFECDIPDPLNNNEVRTIKSTFRSGKKALEQVEKWRAQALSNAEVMKGVEKGEFMFRPLNDTNNTAVAFFADIPDPLRNNEVRSIMRGFNSREEALGQIEKWRLQVVRTCDA